MTVVTRYRLTHESGRSDQLMRTKGGALPIPRVGEFVTLDAIVHGYVFDVNYDYASHDGDDRVTVVLACHGETFGIDPCECTREHLREWRSYVVTGSKPSDLPDPPDHRRHRPRETDTFDERLELLDDDSDTDTDTDRDHDHD